MNEFKTSEIVVALDIGTTKVCAIAGRMNQFGRIEILGTGKVKSEGVSRGVVSNIAKTIKAIQEAVDQAEKSAQVKFKDVYVGIAGQHIKSIHHHGILMRKDGIQEIELGDVDRLINDMYRLSLPPGDKILHVIPQEFTVDNEQNILDPVGMSGVRLEANFHIITGSENASLNIQRCVERVGLNVAEMTLEPIASSAAVLSEQERELGVALIDMGGGTTDITIFKDGIIRHTAVIPFGGEIITNDIKEGCGVMVNQAEKLKTKFGSALSDEIHNSRIITIPVLNNREPKQILEKNLAKIIEARVSEIFDFVMWEIKRSGFERQLNAGLVLTGGGALLKHITLLAEYHTGMNARLGLPEEKMALKYGELNESPIYSTAVGLLINALENMQSKVVQEEEEVKEEVVEKVEEPVLETAGVEEEMDLSEDIQGDKGIIQKWSNIFVSKVSNFFESTPDSDF